MSMYAHYRGNRLSDFSARPWQPGDVDPTGIVSLDVWFNMESAVLQQMYSSRVNVTMTAEEAKRLATALLSAAIQSKGFDNVA